MEKRRVKFTNKEIIRKKPKKIVVKKHKNSAGRTFCLPIYNEEGKIINA
jgi:hypothetical protein|nr:MAG TPA: hypothetical protein [Caudoviricetes sp.]